MSTYRQRGQWRFEFQKHGRRITGFPFRTKAEAKAAEAEARRTYRTRRVTNTNFLTLATARLDALQRRSPSHITKNLRLLRTLMQRWKDRRTVTREDVEAYLAETARSVSNAKANRHLRLIRATFRHGIETGIWEDDPTRGVRMYPGAQAKRYVPPLGDIKKVLAAANDEQRAYLNTVLHSMGRITAVNHLRWEDVGPDYLILRTRKARNSDEKEIRVPLNRTLRVTLDSLPRQSEYVFTNPKTGKPYVYRNQLMKLLCERAQVKRFSYHSLRHYGASHLVKHGVPITDVQQLLGHSQVLTTSIYLRSLGDGVRQAVKHLETIGEEE